MATEERLKKDLKKMEELQRKSSMISFSNNSLLTEYIVCFKCRGIALDGVDPKPIEEHKVRITLKANYPFDPPELECLTPIFHPNIHGETGKICIQGGPWDNTRGLDDVCIQIGKMIQYKNFNVNSYYNKDAAVYALKNWDMLVRLDDRPLIDKEEPGSFNERSK